MKKLIRQTPIWKRFEHCAFGLQELHKDTRSLKEGYDKFFEENKKWNNKFQALTDTVITYDVESGINLIENQIRNETILSIADYTAAMLPLAQEMVTKDVTLFSEIIANTLLFVSIAEFLDKNFHQTDACVAKVQEAETALAKAKQNYEVLNRRLKAATEILSKQKQLYFKVVN